MHAVAGTQSAFLAPAGKNQLSRTANNRRPALRRDPLFVASAAKPSPFDGVVNGLSALFGSGSKTGGGNKEKLRQARKALLLETIEGLQRGLTADKEDVERVDEIARSLEEINPAPKSLSSPYLSGKWELLYTTSETILGKNKFPLFRPTGPIYQTIDTSRLRAKNQEGAPFFNSVSAELEPTSASGVDVQFKVFRILGFIPIKAPGRARGKLEITYVDEELRISRGDKGNLFILQMADRDAELGDKGWP